MWHGYKNEKQALRYGCVYTEVQKSIFYIPHQSIRASELQQNHLHNLPLGSGVPNRPLVMDELINVSLPFLTSHCLLPVPGSFSLEMSRTPQRLAMLSGGFPMATRWVTVCSACAHLCCPASTVAPTALRFQGSEHTSTVQWNVLRSGHSGYKGRITIIIITSALP